MLPAGDSLCHAVEATSYLQLPAKHTCLSLSPIRAAHHEAHNGTVSTTDLQTHLEISLCASTTSRYRTQQGGLLTFLSSVSTSVKPRTGIFFGKGSEWIQKVPSAALDLTVGEEHVSFAFPPLHFTCIELFGMKRELFSSIYLLYYV